MWVCVCGGGGGVLVTSRGYPLQLHRTASRGTPNGMFSTAPQGGESVPRGGQIRDRPRHGTGPHQERDTPRHGTGPQWATQGPHSSKGQAHVGRNSGQAQAWLGERLSDAWRQLAKRATNVTGRPDTKDHLANQIPLPKDKKTKE